VTNGAGDRWARTERSGTGKPAEPLALYPDLAQYGTGADPTFCRPTATNSTRSHGASGRGGDPTRSGFSIQCSNVALYPAFQSYFREHRPPFLAVQCHDPAFLPDGAAADSNVKIHLLDAGHFALETHASEVATLIRAFLISTIGSIAMSEGDIAQESNKAL